MGRSKALLPFGDETLLQRVMRTLQTCVGPIVVVAQADQALPPLPTDVLRAHDERPGQGPLEGIRVGLEKLTGQEYPKPKRPIDIKTGWTLQPLKVK